MELTIYKADGSEAGRTVELDANVFEVEPNEHVLWLDIRRIQANGRQGTHKVKERGESARSTRKLYRQKGTGHSRAGSARSPIRKSGGTTFGPRPRDYGFKVNKKTSQLARRSALSYKAQNDSLRIVEDLALDAPSTRQLVALLEGLDLASQKVLILTAAYDGALYRSSRNVRRVNVQEARNASSLDLIDASVVVLQEGALDVLSEALGTRQPVAAE